MLSEKLVCFTAVFLLILIGAASHAAAATNSSQTGTSGNLLVDPAWENGTSGWETIAINQKGSFEEGELSVSAVCQDIPIEESMAGKALKLSGNISVSPTDPEQKAIILTLELYSDDGKQLCATQAFEKGTTSKYHELMLDITPGAGYARVTIEIRKQGDTNIFSFSDLRLEVTERQPDDNASFRRSNNTAQPGAFRRSAGSTGQEPQTSSEETGGPGKDPSGGTDGSGTAVPGDESGENPGDMPEEEPEYKCAFIEYFNIQISVDDVPVRPENKKGEYEEPFLMEDDCIYLQYEAAASVLGMSASYDEKTKTIKLTSGKIPKGNNRCGDGHTETIEADIAYEGIKVVLDGEEIILTYD